MAIFEADQELKELREDLIRREAEIFLLRERLHEIILRKMKEAGMIDRRNGDRRAKDIRRNGDRRSLA